MCKQEENATSRRTWHQMTNRENNHGPTVRFGTRLPGLGKVMPVPLGMVGAV